MVSVAAPPAAVWELLTDIPRWPDWNPACEQGTMDTDTLGVGTRLRLHLRHPRGRLFWTWPTVTELSPPERLGLLTRAFLVRAPTTITLATSDDGGTDVTLESSSTGALGFAYRLMFPEKTQALLWSGTLTGLAAHMRPDESPS